MEAITIIFDDAEFDKLVHEPSLAQSSTVVVAVKEKATVSGKPGAVIAPDVTLPDGSGGNRYKPHQGAQECARRVRQMRNGTHGL